MKSRIIFLDFDGVLNSRRWIVGAGSRIPGARIDRRAVARLNDIIGATGAKIVVSSSWRHGQSPAELQALLDGFGLVGEVIDKIDERGPDFIQRGHLIRRWLTGREVESYVVLDDEALFDVLPSDRVVRTDFENGLIDEHVDQSIEVLEVAA